MPAGGWGGVSNHVGRRTDSWGAVVLLQLPPVFQTEPHRCGDAAAECLLRFHQIHKSVRLASQTDGADPRVIEAEFRRMGLRVLSGEMELWDIERLCNDRRPVICLVHWPGDGSSHYVLARGISRGRVHVWDVEVGKRSARLDEWMEAWQATDGRASRPFRQWGICAWV